MHRCEVEYLLADLTQLDSDQPNLGHDTVLEPSNPSYLLVADQHERTKGAFHCPGCGSPYPDSQAALVLPPSIFPQPAPLPHHSSLSLDAQEPSC